MQGFMEMLMKGKVASNCSGNKIKLKVPASLSAVFI
jgi:hypothetical protein